MESDTSDTDFFPSQYSSVAVEMLELKNRYKAQQAKLQKETRKKQELLTYLAHDLKTPLSSVIGYLNLLDESIDLPEKQRRKYTHVAFSKACRLEDLINEFFEISRYSLTSVMLDQATFDLSLLLRQVAEELFPLLEEKNQKISLTVNESVMIAGDSDKLARVFNNLFKNAISYGSSDSEIEVIQKIKNERVQITISNEGSKLSAYQLERIFEKFYRGDSSRSTETGGAGLGLAIAKQIIEAHDGIICAESDDDKTTFIVELAVAAT